MSAERWAQILIIKKQVAQIPDTKFPNMYTFDITWAGYVAHLVEIRNECEISVEKPKGKTPPAKPRSRRH
jgi:hypothetical protein